MNDIQNKVYAEVNAGSAEYSKDEAEVSIEEFIEYLEQAQADGATHLIGLSGNYRGAQYVRLGLPRISEEDNDEWAEAFDGS